MEELLARHTLAEWLDIVSRRYPSCNVRPLPANTKRAWPPPTNTDAVRALVECTQSLASMQPALVFGALLGINIWLHDLGRRWLGEGREQLLQGIWCELMRDEWQVPPVLCKPLAFAIVDPAFWQYIDSYSVAHFPLPPPPRYAQLSWSDIIAQHMSPVVAEAARNAFLLR